MKLTRSFVTRAGLVGVPATAFAPLAGAAFTGSGIPWLVLPVGSVAAVIGAACAPNRTSPAGRYGVVLDAPRTAAERGSNLEHLAPEDPQVAPLTVEFAWSDEAA